MEYGWLQGGAEGNFLGCPAPGPRAWQTPNRNTHRPAAAPAHTLHGGGGPVTGPASGVRTARVVRRTLYSLGTSAPEHTTIVERESVENGIYSFSETSEA